jgi:hypothetical protein
MRTRGNLLSPGDKIGITKPRRWTILDVLHEGLYTILYKVKDDDGTNESVSLKTNIDLLLLITAVTFIVVVRSFTAYASTER